MDISSNPSLVFARLQQSCLNLQENIHSLKDKVAKGAQENDENRTQNTFSELGRVASHLDPLFHFHNLTNFNT